MSIKADDFENRVKAAALVNSELDTILCRWEARVRKQMEVANSQDQLLLRDHLLPLLHAISDLLQSNNLAEARLKIADPNYSRAPANESHGRLRATLPGYNLSDVIEEYHHLRAVITELLDEKGLLSIPTMEIVVAETDRAVVEAATHFSSSLQFLRKKAISMLMHDIRSPLNVISTVTEVVKMSGEDYHHEMDVVARSIAKIDGMVSDLLDAVRLEAGQGLELQFNYCELGGIINICVEAAQLTYPDKIEMKLPEHAVKRFLDSTAISRALENLISNAVKYGDPNEKVTVTLEESPEHYGISVHNSGAPIEKADQAALFNAFTRGRNQGQDLVTRGWGLGLAYVRAIAQGHGGDVQVQSGKESGTTFTMLLPKEFEPPD